ncbi:S-layer homology domain-containing protein [Gorillibacterium sp. sgz5001074]|uniref:S-layer homology domain-containing protein n=1 Tax=Gorillibacterium sp. sgz5001074 TaxID=3446695 RepID=UPI003F6725F7
MNRKLRILGLLWILCISLLPVQVYAASAPVLSLRSEGGSVKVDDTVTVTVAARNLTGLYGNEVQVAYDANLLQVVSVKHEIPGGNPITLQAVGLVTMANFFVGKSAGLSGDQTLYTLTFRAKAQGEAAVVISSMKLIGTGAVAMQGTVGSGSSVKITAKDTSANPNPGSSSGTSSSAPPSSSPGLSASSALVADAVTGSDGVAVARVEPAQLAGYLETASARTPVIEVKAASAQELKIVLPAGPLQAVQEGKRITVRTGIASFTLAPSLVKASQSGDELVLEIARENAGNLPEVLRRRLGSDAPVYDFSLSLNGRTISVFRGEEVTVEIPYTLRAGENPHQVVLWHISDEGGLESVKTGKYDPATGMAVFKPKHFSRYAVSYRDVGFQDLKDHAWAQDAILRLAALDVLHGTGSGRFTPEGQVTRAEFVTMLVQAFGLQDPSARTDLQDVKEGAWYYPAVASAEKMGIVKGIGTDRFGVDEPVNRQDMAVLIHRTVLSQGGVFEAVKAPAAFADRSRIAEYALPSVEAMQRAGILEGKDQGVFAPAEYATRAEAAVLIGRLLR